MEPAAYTPPDQHHKLDIASDDSKASELVMPYLFGKTAGESIQILTQRHIAFRLTGSGTVIRQFPVPGTLLNRDDLCIISLATNNQPAVMETKLNVEK